MTGNRWLTPLADAGALGYRRFAAGAEAVGFAGEVVPIEVAVDAGHEGSEEAGVVEREGDAAMGAHGVDLVPGDDLDAEGVGGPGEDVALFVERSDAPDGGHEPGLPDACAAAKREPAEVHTLNPGDGGGPLGPTLDVKHD